MVRIAFHLTLVLFLTLLTQLGGLAWLIALFFRRRVLVFGACYAALSVTALAVAPIFGRDPVPCFSQGTLRMHTPLYCALNRQYVTPDLMEVLQDVSTEMHNDFPDTATLVLDANFPFLDGFPLLPHLSHDDGRKADLAFFYRDQNGFLPGVTKSPLGYFAFEPGPTDCPARRLTLRWDLAWAQDFWPDYHLDPRRMSAALRILSLDQRVGKIFLEPHLKSTLGATSPKIRFQGCRAARHDDHIHLQL